MRKDGYWLQGSGYGYGYPMFGYSYGELGVSTPTNTSGNRKRRLLAGAAGLRGPDARYLRQHSCAAWPRASV